LTAPHTMGNHTIAERMFRHDARAMLYAQLRTLIWEDSASQSWPEHHLQLGDQPFFIEREFVDALDVLSVHVSRELEDRDAVCRFLELVAHSGRCHRPRAPAQPPAVPSRLGRDPHRLEHDGAEKDGVLVEQKRRDSAGRSAISVSGSGSGKTHTGERLSAPLSCDA
jgi:hypothetical protein